MGSSLSLDGYLNREKKLQILLLVFISYILILVVLVFSMWISHLFLVSDDYTTNKQYSYSQAWTETLKFNPISFVLMIWNIPAIWFLGSLLLYHTYLSWYNMTTSEHMKHYFQKVTYTPYTSGFMLKDLFSRIFESTPKSLLTMELRVRDKITIHETKAELERKFDIK